MTNPMNDELTELFNRWWDDKGAALAPGGGGEETRRATETAWRSGCYIPDLPNPCLHAEADELLLMRGHAPGPEPLSPAAQAILDAFRTSHTGQGCLAAALRAAARYCTRERRILMTIADELEAASQSGAN